MKESQRNAYLGIVGSLRNPTYENFIEFVKVFLKSHMSLPFIEEDYYRTIWEDVWNNRYCLLQLPRGHSKTELIGIWMTIYFAVCQPKNPFNKDKKDINQQMIISGDSTAKHAWSERIKHFFYENDFLRTLIPEGADRKKQNAYWNDRVMYLTNGHMILIRSIEERAIRGNHVDRLHADDVVTENSTMVDSKIKEKWDGSVDGVTTNKQAMVQVTGTPLRMSDILFHLKDRGYKFVKMPAITDYDNKIILSPKRWTFENLIETKERIGSVRFNCEYMLEPIDDSTSLIKSECVRQCFDKNLNLCKTRPESIKSCYLGVDFAFEDRITSDKSAFVILGENEIYDEVMKKNRKIYTILDIITKKGMSALEQFNFIKELHDVYRFDMIGLEENSIKAVSKEISKFNLPIKRYWTGTRDEKGEQGPRKEYETVGKRNLILRLGTAFEQKQIRIPYANEEARKKADELLSECISFAQEEDKLIEVGVHPDIPIALAYAQEVGMRPKLAWAFINI